MGPLTETVARRGRAAGALPPTGAHWPRASTRCPSRRMRCSTAISENATEGVEQRNCTSGSLLFRREVRERATATAMRRVAMEHGAPARLQRGLPDRIRGARAARARGCDSRARAGARRLQPHQTYESE